MSVLSRHLLKQNLYLMGVCLCLGVVIYLLSDLFERLDDFLAAGLGAVVMLTYFGVKIPLIISQILPAVFLVAMLIQLSAMRANRELLALRAGGIPYGVIIVFFLAYSLLWSGTQLFFSQYLGGKGMEYSKRIWSEDVRGREESQRRLHNVWFRDGERIIHITTVMPALGQGTGLNIYTLAADRQSINQIIQASSFQIRKEEWTLSDVLTIDPDRFTSERTPSMGLHLGVNLESLAMVDSKMNPAQLPLWDLGRTINKLQATGSNVEGLRTIWHGKISYAFSISVMALLALAIITFERNVYLNLTAGLMATFMFYGFFVLGSSAGEMGFLPPLAGAWLGNILIALAAVARLFWRSMAGSVR